MPTYDYKCKKCGNIFEKFQSITENPIKKCISCDGEVYRLISKNANFILKGKGYYSTDNRNNIYKPENKKLIASKKEEPSINSKSEIKEKNKKEGIVK